MVEDKDGKSNQKPPAEGLLLRAIFGSEIFDATPESKPKSYTPDEVDKIRAIISNALTPGDKRIEE